MPLRTFFAVAACACALLLSVFDSDAQLQRVPNASLVMPESMPTLGYTSSNAFPGLSFTNPVCIVSPPGETNRLFIVGKNGVIYAITNLAAPTESIFMDISSRVTSTVANTGVAGEQGLLSMAFDPGYATNNHFYVFYTGQATNGTVSSSLHHFLSRFNFTSGNTNQGNANFETPLYIQFKRAQNHNGGDIVFGPDGYLYVSVGDEGLEYDYYTNAQHITWRLWAGILRLDVDKIDPLGLPPNVNSDLGNIFSKTTNYNIPHDNPFVGATNFDGLPINATNVQTEFWATGLRNPWRMSFDPATGNLFCGDVGQDQYEEADIITKGGNYGWAWWEGNSSPPSGVSSGILAATPYPSNAIPPFVTYSHSTSTTTGYAIMGGVVYRGQNLPQLYGDYVFGDYVDGNIWAIPATQAVSLTATNGTITPPPPIFTDSIGFSAFGVDPRNGDVLYTSMNGSIIKRIIYNSTSTGTPLPPTLYDTGAFTNLLSLTSPQQALQPAAGILPYTINVPFWSDNAIKSRWFSVPNTNLAIGFNPNGNWSFPTGMVFIKNFNMELTNGDPASQVRLETRFIVVNSSGVYGLTYIWNSQTNAILAPASGWSTNLAINNGGMIQTQTWHFPSQSECLICHTPAGGYGLGFRTEQLNDTQDYGFGLTNEIQALSAAGYFSSPVTNNPSTLLALAASTNTAYSLEFRARSFLMANCSQCHQPAGTAQQSLWDARITTPTALAGLINGGLINNLGNANNYVVAPGSPTNSVLLIRDSTRDLGANPSFQMPPLDSYLVDSDATNLVTEWILSLTNMFWLGGTPGSEMVTLGSDAVYSIAYLATPGFNSDATLSVGNLPPGMTASFSPANVNRTATNSTLTITTFGLTPRGIYTLTVVGSGGNVTNSTTIKLTVTGPPTPPLRITGMALSGHNFIFNGSNGVPGWPYWVLSSTNLSLPLNDWTFVAANSFDTSGNFFLTNPIGNNPQRFFLLAVPPTVTGPSTPRPRITGTAVSGHNFIFNGNNGLPGWPYLVLSSTNLSLPVNDWTFVSTNFFNTSGNFFFTSPIGSNAQLFYLLEVP
jgi:glucose/arabinose dehydrogenase